MKILQITPSYKPAWETGGTARVAYEVSRRLVERGHEVTVFTTDRAKKRLHETKMKPQLVDAVRVYYFRNLSNILALNNIPIPLGYLSALSKGIEKPDLIHIHEHRSTLAFAAAIYASKANVPYVVQSHGSLASTIGKRRFKGFYDMAIGNWILHNASGIIALSEAEKQECCSMGVPSEKVAVIPNGFDTTAYASLPHKGSFKSRMGLEPDDRIVLYLGRMNRSKGLDLLVEAYSIIARARHDVILALVGPDDGDRNRLERLAHSLNLRRKIVFLDFVSEDEKMQALVDSDVLVIPKFYGFPLTFLEACACGVPLITTDGGDSLDWIDNMVGIVTKGNALNLSEGILTLIGNNELAAEYGASGKKLVNESFTWNQVINRLEAFYFAILNDAKSHSA